MSLKGKYIWMTGATSGLGKESALYAAGRGAHLKVLSRNKTKGEQLLSEFEARSNKSNGSIELVEGDLSSFQSLVDACSKNANWPRIDMLVHNAGIMNFEFMESNDGIEETLQVNLLSPLLITNLLYPLLCKSDEPKLIFTASALHQGEIDFQDLENRNEFTSFKVYRQSKLGVILCSRWLAQKLEKQNIGVYTNHPGIVNTNLGRSAGWFSRFIFRMMGRSPKKGAETLNYLMKTPNAKLKMGAYYADKKVKETSPESYDMQVAAKLMKVAYNYLKNYLPEDSKLL